MALETENKSALAKLGDTISSNKFTAVLAAAVTATFTIPVVLAIGAHLVLTVVGVGAYSLCRAAFKHSAWKDVKAVSSFFKNTFKTAWSVIAPAAKKFNDNMSNGPGASNEAKAGALKNTSATDFKNATTQQKPAVTQNNTPAAAPKAKNG